LGFTLQLFARNIVAKFQFVEQKSCECKRVNLKFNALLFSSIMFKPNRNESRDVWIEAKAEQFPSPI
jgi:hypothetical protein